MATRTIANGGGTWASTGTWVEGAVPTSADDVVATATSGNVTIAAAAACRSIDLTGYTGTLTHNATRTLTIGDGTDPPGNNALVFPSSGWTYTLGNATSSALSFASTSATVLNINTGGKTCGNVTFNGVGGLWALTGNLVSSGTLTLTNGSFNANGYAVTAAFLSSSNSNTRSLTVGSGQWTLTGNAGNVIQMTSTTNLTLTRGSLPILLTYSGSTGTRTVSGGTPGEGSALDVKVTAGSDTVSLSNQFRNLTFDGFTGTWSNSSRTIYGDLTIASASASMTWGSGASNTTFAATSGVQNITTSGVTATSPIIINAPGATVKLLSDFTSTVLTSFTHTAGGFDANGFNLTMRDYTSSNSNVRSLSMGSGTWTLNGGTVWDTTTTTNMTFDAGTGSVVLDPSSSKTVKQGSLLFYSLTMQLVGVARSIIFTDGQTAGATNSITLTGSAGQLLTLQGSSTGGWTLAVPTTQSLGYLSVSRSTATGNTALAGSTSTDGGNNTNWNFGPPVNSVAPSCAPSSGTVADTFTFAPGTWTGSPTSYETSVSVDGGAYSVIDTSAGGNPAKTGTQLGGPGSIATRVRAQNAGGWSGYVAGTTLTVTSGGRVGTGMIRLGINMGL